MERPALSRETAIAALYGDRNNVFMEYRKTKDGFEKLASRMSISVADWSV